MQLWFYVAHGINPQQLVAWGFLNLDHLEKSMVMAATPDARTYLQGLNFMQRKIIYEPAFLSEGLPRYQQQEQAWIAQMQRGEFPRNFVKDKCKYCPWLPVCGE